RPVAANQCRTLMNIDGVRDSRTPSDGQAGLCACKRASTNYARTVRLKADTTGDVPSASRRTLPETCRPPQGGHYRGRAVRLKADTTGRRAVRLKADTTGDVPSA